MKRPRNIYLVTSGEYSDYGVSAVFSSLKGALDYAGTGSQVELYVLNEPGAEPIARRLWNVHMTKDGTVEGCNHEDITVGQECAAPQLWNGAVIFEVMAKTKEQAIKAANEQRAQMIALNRWPTKDGYWA